MRTRHAASLLIAVSLVTLFACKKKAMKAGDPCKTEWATDCVDKKNAMVCVNGKLEAIACRDITGCMDMGDGNDNCDNTTHNVGEPCKKDGDYECSVDTKAMLKCDSKHWTKIDDCKGQHGCVSNAKGATCDKGSGNVGDPCTSDQENTGACTPDGKSLILCHSGKMVLGSTCKGLNGCRQAGTKLDCNNTVADVGDPCEGDEGKPACGTDKKTHLVCKSGKFVKDRTCKSCSVMIDKVECQ